MKENRQEIERTIKEVKITYTAIDGTEFINEEECRKYEETAECVLLSKYRPLVIKSTTEYDVFGVGSDDSTLEIVKINKPEDADILLQLYRLYNPHLEKPEYKKYIDAAAKKLSLALQGSGLVFVGRGCDDDYFWIIGSQESVMQVIKDACKPEEKKDDTEGENHGA